MLRCNADVTNAKQELLKKGHGDDLVCGKIESQCRHKGPTAGYFVTQIERKTRFDAIFYLQDAAKE